MFGQTYSPQDLVTIAVLVLFEGLLSIDNALVLALLAKKLPEDMRGKALTYGLIGSFFFRFVMIGSAAYLLHWSVVKLIGGGYLIYISVAHFFEKKDDSDETDVAHAGPPPSFWATVAKIELTDVAFAVDSILAAIALVGSAPAGTKGLHPKLWVVVIGGAIGVMLMRVAAAGFIKLLERFPRLEISAYLLVMIIGIKLLIDWGFNTEQQPHRADFQHPASVLFWAFWSLMAICVAVGFLPSKRKQEL